MKQERGNEEEKKKGKEEYNIQRGIVDRIELYAKLTRNGVMRELFKVRKPNNKQGKQRRSSMGVQRVRS